MRPDGIDAGLAIERHVAPEDARGASAVVGVVVLIGVTAIAAAAVGLAVGVGTGVTDDAAPAPRLQVTGTASADDDWPDGQVLTLTHRAGERVRVSALTFVIVLENPDRRARLSGFPTRRLTDENVRGASIFDGTFAGVDGAVDAIYTDGAWTSGERVAFRIERGEYDLDRGETVRVEIVHEPTNAVVAQLDVPVT